MGCATGHAVECLGHDAVHFDRRAMLKESEVAVAARWISSGCSRVPSLLSSTL